MVTVQAKLVFDSSEDKQKVLDLMRRWSSCMRYAYKRLLEGHKRDELKRELQKVFALNSRYVDDAIMKAESVIKSCKKKGENPRKVIFGSKELFEKLKRRHISGRAYKKLQHQWQEKRKGNLYSRGDKSKKGNLNTRIEIDENATLLRINVGKKQYVYARIQAGWKIKNKTYIDRNQLLQAMSTSGKPLAKEKQKAIVIESLSIQDRGRRGDFSGRKSRRIRHYFGYRSLLEKVKLLAKREGIEVIEVDPAYTSVIGMLKYAPQYMVSKDIAAAYVIARRGLGLRERIPHKLYVASW